MAAELFAACSPWRAVPVLSPSAGMLYYPNPRSLTTPPSLAPLIVTPWYGGTCGGVAVATESLAHSLLYTGGDCAVIRLAPDGVTPNVSFGTAGEEIVDLCVRSDRLSRGSIKLRTGYHVRRRVAERTLRRLVDDHGLRIAHFHFAAAEFDILIQLAREAGLGIVTTFHGADVNDFLVNSKMRPVVEEIARCSDRITVVSRSLRDRLLNAVPELAPRLTLVSNLVPTSFASRNETPPSAPTTPRWHILLVGHLIPRKGGDVLLDAIARVICTVPDVRVAFAGAGEFESTLRGQAARLGITGHVAFLGEISRDAIEDAYSQTLLLAIPSRSEGLPLVLLESQWMGVPVVASAVDGLPDAITDGENGLLVPPEDPEALALAIIRILTDDALRAKLGTCASRRARERFSPAITASAFQDIYAGAYRDRASMNAR